SKDVDQTPHSIIKKIGESVDKEIRCSHSIPSYQVILWYKQDKHKALKLLGYQNNDFANLEQDVKGKINFEGDGRKQSILTVSNLTVDDSAVYFCAASQHSAAESHEVNTKTLQKEREHLQSASILFCFFPTGAPSAYEVLQTPCFAAPKPGESVMIHCSHSVSIFERILWYKQEKHGALRFLGYMNRNFPNPEGDVKDKMDFGGDGSKHATLNISTVSENDSAVYFC
uniref:Ig-like domain-containing protein n=1 Tax=Poecilia formosa TaxID=48698 RepID=A0A096MEA8_POEFO